MLPRNTGPDADNGSDQFALSLSTTVNGKCGGAGGGVVVVGRSPSRTLKVPDGTKGGIPRPTLLNALLLIRLLLVAVVVSKPGHVVFNVPRLR